MSVTVETESYSRARRNRRAAITIGVILAVLFGGFYFAASYWTSPPAKSTATPSSSCSTSVKAAQVTVNVFNATKRNGLAASTAKAVAARGFVVGTIANDNSKKAVPQPAEVRFGPAGEASSALVLALVPGAVPVKDTRADGSIDLVLGDAFTELAPVASTAPTC